MREDDVTRLLVDETLARCSPAVTDRFLSEVCALDAVTSDGWAHLTQVAAWQDLGQRRGAVIGVAPAGTVGGADRKTTPGSTIDGVIAGAGVLVLLEVKTNLPHCEWAQLVRHARKWALDVVADEPEPAADTLPPGFAIATWRTVGGWLARELGRADASQDRPRLGALADTLTALGLCELDAGVPPAPATTTLVATRHPHVTPLSDIVAGWDLDRVRAACARLYGAAGTHRVGSDGCVADALSMIDAFRAAGLEPLRGLREQQHEGPMTPRRVLTALYAEDARQRDATPGDWTALRDRVLARGGDRDVLIAMLAWAMPRDDAKGKHLRRVIPQVWSLAPDEPGPGLPELTDALARIPRPPPT